MGIGQRLNWLWRLCATGLSFLVFGIVGMLAPLVAVPLLYLLPGDRHLRERRARRVVHGLFLTFSHFMRALGLLRWEIRGLENLGRPGALVLANHPTLLDIVFLVAFLPDANCLVKGRLARNPAMRGFIHLTGYITNDSGPGLIADAEECLRSGSTLVVFPEGTRTPREGLITMQRGAANIALRCRKNITPVVIRCDPPTLRKGDMWYHIPPRPFVVSFNVREDIPIVPWLADSTSREARRLTRYLERYFSMEVDSMASEDLKHELKALIIETLELEDLSAGDILDHEPLFNDGLGLDSIDALEIGVALQKRYGIKLDPEKDEIKRHFASINDLAGLVAQHREEGRPA